MCGSPAMAFSFFYYLCSTMQMNILNDIELAQLQQAIGESNHIVVCCHKGPDGDAIGSSLAWTEYLRQAGKEATLVIPDAFPDFLKWLPGVERIVRHDRHPKSVEKLFGQADLVFCLDFNVLGRVEDMEQVLTASPAKKIMIDHHLNPDMDTVLTVSHPEMSSTSEMIFRIIWQLGAFDMMTKKIAVPIYCGMMTDTGGFTYNSSRPEIYFIIGQLLTKGFDKDKIYRQVFNNYSSWAIRFRGYLMSQKLNVFEDLHASYFAVTKQDMEDYHFIKGDLEGLVNEPLRIKGLKLSISLREDDRHENTVLVSTRSVDDFPCNLLATEFFNGGGHMNAAGGKLHCSMAEAEQIARRAIAHYESFLKG